MNHKMNRKLLCVGGLLFALLCGTLASSSGRSKPNVLIIAIDDLKPAIGSFGDEHAITPAIDRLAERGLVFNNAYCQQAVCGASRASFFTGLRPDTVQVWDFKSKMRDRLSNLVTLPQHFKNNGYHTASVGKVFDFRCCDGEKTNDVASWSQAHSVVRTPHLYLNHYGSSDAPALITRNQQQFIDRGETPRQPGQSKPTTERLDENVDDSFFGDGLRADWAVDFLKNSDELKDPFFLVVGFKKPHLPFIAPKRYWDLYDAEKLPLAEYQARPEGAPDFHHQDSWELRSGYGNVPKGILPESEQRRLVHGYYACVSYIDMQIGRILEVLEEQGLAENTIIALWGDHGWHLGDHGMWCKHTNYEQSARVPLMLVDPRRELLSKGLVRRPVESIDLAPTLAELCGIPNLGSFEGESLTPFFASADYKHKRFAVSQFARSNKPGGDNLMGYAFRDERYRYIAWVEMAFKEGERSGPLIASELYDLQEDPFETRNLVGSSEYGAVVKRIARRATKFARSELGVEWTP